MQNEILVSILEDDIDSVKSYIAGLSEEKKKRIARSSNHIRNGLYALAPIICHGIKRCAFANHCPIPEVIDGIRIDGPDSDYPISRPCILEATFIKQKTLDYIDYLKVDVENPIEMSIVNELALIDLYKNRAAMILSSGDRDSQGVDFLRIDSAKSDNGNGDSRATIISTSSQVHPAFNVIDTLEKRRDRLLDKLIETRKSKSDLAIKMGRKKEDSLLIEEIKKMRQLLAEQQTQVQQLTTKEEVILLKD